MLPTDTVFESKFTFETEANPLDEQPPFHILILGDWSANGAKKDLSERRPIVVDRDNFDEVLNRLKVTLEIDLNGDGNLLTVQFTELDDFHPDNLFRQISLFSDLRDVRRRLLNADSFNESARQVRNWFNTSKETEKQEVTAEFAPIDSENLLDQILSQPGENLSSKPEKIDNSELGRFVSKIVSPSLVKIDENEQLKLVAAVDEATSQLMRTILHHPQFQALESAWRGLHFLVRRVETDVDLKIFIIDVSQTELTDNLKTVSSLADSFLYHRLVVETVETLIPEPFAVVCGNYSFGVNVDDIAALMRIAKIANIGDVSFISHIRPEMFGAKSFFESADFSEWKFFEDTNEGKLWRTLRTISESDSLGLLPIRFLARLSYGAATDSTETFYFEELTDDFNQEKYLWTNPIFAFTLLLAQSYKSFGWDEMEENFRRDIEGLPMPIYNEAGEIKTKSCGEIVLTENLSEILLCQGLMPLLSYRDLDLLRFARFQSVSDPLRNLKGKWHR